VPTLDVAGRTAAYTEHGPDDGVPVVLVHSSGLSAGQWRKHVPALVEAGHRVLVPDLFGYGQSDPWPVDEPFEARDDAAIVEALIDLGSPGPTHLVGHSYGGVVAAVAALRRPGAAGRLVLFEPVLFGVLRAAASPSEVARWLPFDDTFFDADPDGGYVGFVSRLVDFWNGPGAWDALGAARQAPFAATAVKVRQEVLGVAADRRDARDLEALTQPVLLLSGGRTVPEAGRATCAALAAALPDARHVVVEDAGHMGPITHADVVAPITIAFLDE